MARKRATLTDLLNDLTFRVLFDKYKMLACSAFEWEGLPDDIEERHIERELFDHGKAVFFRDDEKSFMCLEVNDTGKVNVYGDPLYYRAVGMKYQKLLKADKCVIVENNMFRLNTYNFLLFYVNKLTEAERTMDVNVKACKTPYIIACDDKDVMTFKRIFQMIDGNTPAIYADKGLNLDALNVLKTDAKFLGNDLMDYKKAVENELMTFLGFNNSPIDKKERVNVSEANSNNQLIEAFADLQLKARQKACEEINKKYGLELSVRRRPLEEVTGNVDDNSLRDQQTNR